MPRVTSLVEPLRTSRLLLRRWRREDRAPFAALNADPLVMQHFPGVLVRAESDALAARPPGCRNVRKSDEARMIQASRVDKKTKIRIDRDEHAPIGFRPFQPVTWAGSVSASRG